MSQERIFAKTLHNFPAIASLEIVIDSEPSYDVCLLPAKSVLESCRHVSRDLAYVARLLEDVQDILSTCPEYHETWISEVRVAASGALNRTNSHIAAIIPGIEKMPDLGSSQARSKVQKLAKDRKPLATLERQLSVAHASLLSVLELLHRLALQRGKLAPDETELEKMRIMPLSRSFRRASSQNFAPTPTSPLR